MTENTSDAELSGEGGLGATAEQRLAADPALEPELAHERDEAAAQEAGETEAQEEAEAD